MKGRRQQKRQSFFGSLKGKLLIMGSISLITSIILGIVGITSLNKNNAYNQILEAVNDVNVKQYENQSLETSYLYFLEDSYLEKLTVNLEEMHGRELGAQGLAGGRYDKAMESMAEITEKCQENYNRLRTLSSERGFTVEQGKYADFASGDDVLQEQLRTAVDDKGWIDGGWEHVEFQNADTAGAEESQEEDTAGAEESQKEDAAEENESQKMDEAEAKETPKEDTAGEKTEAEESQEEDAAGEEESQEGDTAEEPDSYTYTYTTEIPKEGKRDNFIIRLGGNHVECQKKILVGNIVFSGKGGNRELAVAEKFQEISQASYGDALKGLEQERFNDTDMIAVQAEFHDVDGNWKELAIKISVADFNIQDYDRVSIDVFFEPGDYGDLNCVCTFAEKYNFANTQNEINNGFSDYSRHVIEGKETDEEMEALKNLFEVMEANLEIYLTEGSQRSEIESLLMAKHDAFDEMSGADQEIFQVKNENKELFDQLTQEIVEIRSEIENAVTAEKRGLTTLILAVSLLGVAVMLFGSVYISRSINGSMRSFKGTLEQVTDGNLQVRAEERGRDEFSVFGTSLNSLLSRLEEVIGSAQKISGTVSRSGEQMETMANDSCVSAGRIEGAVGDIARGASRQAEEIDNVTRQTAEMGEVFSQIMGSVEKLDTVTGQMQKVSRETIGFMGELADFNEKTTGAFEQVSRQIHATNESAEKIHEAADLIISIASQTNLLSLNASIEAARAGEAGRGFAVVASEIQDLSVQTNSSVGIIENIIRDLTEKAGDTVVIMDELTENIQKQMEKMQTTQKRLEKLDEGIHESGMEAEEIKQATISCDKLRSMVADSVESLASISEANASSAEETNYSMSKLNETVVHVSESARELKEISEDLNGKLQFFHLDGE